MFLLGNILFISAGLLFSLTVSQPGKIIETRAVLTDLIISEYYESNGGTHKAIEIYNGTGNSVDLLNYSLVLYSNGNSYVTGFVNLSGTLTNDNVLVVYNSSTTRVPLGDNKLAANNVINFNGDDAIVLYNNGGSPLSGTTGSTGTVTADMEDETLVDIIGVIGQDGNNDTHDAFIFTSANNAVLSGTTTNSILVRDKSVTAPNTTFTGTEWLCFTVINSSATGLLEPDSKTTSFGSHTTSTLDKVYAENFGYYILNSTTGKVGVCTVEGLNWSNLSSSFSSMTANEQAAFANNTNTSQNITSALARYDYLRAFNPSLTNFLSR